jgi:hypothetical protein
MIRAFLVPSLVALVAGSLCSGEGRAAVIMQLQQSERGVDATLGGTLDFDDLPGSHFNDFGRIFRIGTIGVSVSLDGGVVDFGLVPNETPYGLSGMIEAFSEDGTSFGRAGTGGLGKEFAVPDDYDGRTRLDAEFGLAGATFSLMGLVEGTERTMPFHADTLTIVVGDGPTVAEIPPAPIPVPSTLPLLLGALAGSCVIFRKRRTG